MNMNMILAIFVPFTALNGPQTMKAYSGSLLSVNMEAIAVKAYSGSLLTVNMEAIVGR
jgi:hypothetical protein